MKLRPMMTSELKILKTVYPIRGSVGVRELLPHRSRGTINVQAHRLGLKVLPGAKRRYTDDAVREALAACGFCAAQAAAVLGCSHQTVHTYVRRLHREALIAARSRSTSPDHRVAA